MAVTVMAVSSAAIRSASAVSWEISLAASKTKGAGMSPSATFAPLILAESLQSSIICCAALIAPGVNFSLAAALYFPDFGLCLEQQVSPHKGQTGGNFSSAIRYPPPFRFGQSPLGYYLDSAIVLVSVAFGADGRYVLDHV